MGTLCEYQKEFERIASCVHERSKKALVGEFISGLKAEIASEVRVHRPKTYAKVINIVRIHNDHLRAAKKGRNLTGPQRFEEATMDGCGIEARKDESEVVNDQLKIVVRPGSPGIRR
ncbi:hypothetical protein ACS0TY_014345 [Phlomoides rotata]